VTSKSDLSAAVEYIAQKSGYVNLVIANSGISGPHHFALSKDASLEEFRNFQYNLDFDKFNSTYSVNTTGVFFTVIAFLDLLDKGNKAGNVTQKSQVVAISSIAGYSRASLVGFAYETSKAAATLLMKQFSTNLARYEIRANVVAPGSKSNYAPLCLALVIMIQSVLQNSMSILMLLLYAADKQQSFTVRWRMKYSLHLNSQTTLGQRNLSLTEESATRKT
jgi:NAD(P)-dependent dehydrogenase (short-subunit alcohol dehydrogenase family)